MWWATHVRDRRAAAHVSSFRVVNCCTSPWYVAHVLVQYVIVCVNHMSDLKAQLVNQTLSCKKGYLAMQDNCTCRHARLSLWMPSWCYFISACKVVFRIIACRHEISLRHCTFGASLHLTLHPLRPRPLHHPTTAPLACLFVKYNLVASDLVVVFSTVL